MTVTLERLANYLGMAGVPTDPEKLTDLQDTLDEAIGDVETAIAKHHGPPPEDRTRHQLATTDGAVLAVAGENWRRRNAPGGVYQVQPGVDEPVRLTSDPMALVWPRLQRARLVRPAVGKKRPTEDVAKR